MILPTVSLCACLLAQTVAPDSQRVESYPAIVFGPKVSGEMEQRLLSLIPQRPKDGLPGLGLGKTDWYASGRHPYLDSVLPGVSFFLARTLDARVEVGGPGSEDFPIYDLVALRGGKLYRLRGLNQLLLDAGFPMDSTSALAAAKVAVLFTLLGDQFTHNFSPWPSYDELRYTAPAKPDSAQAFPAVEFRKVERDTTTFLDRFGVRHRTLNVRVDCVVNDSAQQFVVGFINFAGFIQPHLFLHTWFDQVSPRPSAEEKPAEPEEPEK